MVKKEHFGNTSKKKKNEEEHNDVLKYSQVEKGKLLLPQ